MFKDKENILRLVEEEFPRSAVIVLGDAMLDRYYFGDVHRISPEAPVPITRVTRERDTLGGAANVAHNLALLGCRTILAGVCGADDNRVRLVRLLEARGIDHSALVTADRPTTTKLRVIGGHQQMLRLDFEETGAIPPETEERLKAALDSAMHSPPGCMVISDYAKGACTANLCQYIIKQCAAAGIPQVVDPKGPDWRKYAGAFLVTPNVKELGEAAGAPVPNEDGPVRRAAERVRRKFGIKNVIVTRSEKGLSLIADGPPLHIPTHAQEVFDVSGAGDTVAA